MFNASCLGASSIGLEGIEDINTRFTLLHQEKKEIHNAVQTWSIQNLTKSRRHAQFCTSHRPIQSYFSYQASRLPAASFEVSTTGSGTFETNLNES